MKRTAAYRFTSDICFYYVMLSFFPALLPLQRAMALFAAASLAVSLAAVYCPWAPLRFLLALLPGLAFLRAGFSFTLVFPALAWLYLILVLTAGRFQTWLEGYRRSFRIMLLLYLFALIAFVLMNLVVPGIAVFLPGIAYAMAFLCLGAIAMRCMQMNAEMSFRWKLANGAVVIGVPLLTAGVSLLLWWLLRLLKPVFAALSPVLRGFLAWLVNTLLPINPDVPEPTPTPQPTLTPAEEAITDPGYVAPTPDIPMDWYPEPEQMERVAKIGIAVLLALLALALVLIILRRVRSNRARSDQEDFHYEETVKGSPLRRSKVEKLSDPTNARRIRSIYRQYLVLMRKRGLRIRKDNTSLEILDGSELLGSSPEAVRLRELYVSARYDVSAPLTVRDVQEAAACLQKIREDR